MQYPVQPPSQMTTATKAGIGAGSGVAALIITGLTGLLFLSRRKDKMTKKCAAIAAVEALMKSTPPTSAVSNTPTPSQSNYFIGYAPTCPYHQAHFQTHNDSNFIPRAPEQATLPPHIVSGTPVAPSSELGADRERAELS
jgi:hypothetical protein